MGVALVFVSEGAEGSVDSQWSYSANDDVRVTATSANGKYLAAGTHDSKVILFTPSSNSPVWTYTVQHDYVFSMSFSADGNYLAVGTMDSDNTEGGLYLFETSTSTPEWKKIFDSGPMVDISANGEYIIAATSADKKAYIFEKSSNSPTWSETFDVGIGSISISADGVYYVIGMESEEDSDDENRVFLYKNDDHMSSEEEYELDSSVNWLDMSADGEYFVAGTQDRVYLISKDSSTPEWYNETDEPVRVSISADGQKISTYSFQTAALYDRESSTAEWTYTLNKGENVEISQDGKFAVWATNYGSSDRIYVFRTNSSSLAWKSTTFDGGIKSLSISSDSRYISVGTEDSDDSIYLFNNSLISGPSVIPYSPLNDTEQLLPPTLFWFSGSSDIDNLTFDIYIDKSSNVTKKVASGVSGNSFSSTTLEFNQTYYWKIVANDPSGSSVSEIREFVNKAPSWTNFAEEPHDFGMVTVSQDGQYILAMVEMQGLFLFDNNGSLIWTTNSNSVSQDPQALAISSSGDYIATLNDDYVYLFSKNSSSYLWRAGRDIEFNTFRDLDISETGDLIAVVCENGLFLYSKDSSTPLWTYSHSNSNHLTEVSISADGNRIAVGAEDGADNFYLFEKSGNGAIRGESYSDDINDIQISADGKYVVLGTGEDVYLYDCDTGDELWDYSTVGSVEYVDLSYNGEHIVALSYSSH